MQQKSNTSIKQNNMLSMTDKWSLSWVNKGNKFEELKTNMCQKCFNGTL